MKRKGINPLEQHAEKAVVGVFLIAAAGVFALQIVQPVKVSVESNRVSPERAYERVASRADEIGGRLRTDRLPDGLPEAPANIAADLDKRLRAPASHSQKLVGALGRPNSGMAGAEGPAGGEGLPTYALLIPPTTGKPVAAEHRATLDPLVVASVPSLAAHLPPSQPYDARVVSVSARFPTDQLVQRLSEDPDGSGPAQAPPRFWWLNAMAVLDVRLEREELQADGSFGERALIALMPEQYSLRNEIGVAGRDLGPALREARMRMADVAQPRFYATIAGPDWAPPVVSAPETAGETPSVDLLAEIARKKRTLEQMDAQIKKQQESIDKPQPATRPGGTTTPSVRPGGVGGGGAGGSMARAQPSKSESPSQTGGGSSGAPQVMTPEDRRKEALLASIARLEKDREGLAAEIAAMESQMAGGSTALADAPADFAVRALESGEPFAVWAHDLTAAPGKTYRYRVSVVITNPLYGNARSMSEVSRPLAGQPAIVSEPSAWSEPVRVLPDAVVFFTSARGTGLGGESGATASAEIYRFYYGHWRGKSTTLRPGDALFAEVDLPPMPLFEVSGGADGSKVIGQTMGPTKISAGISGGFIVDVLSTPSEGPGGRDQVWQVVYRDSSGRLAVSTPGSGSSDPLRRAVEASLAAGRAGTVREPGVSKPVDPAVGTPSGTTPERPASGPAGLGGLGG